jgi:hypothetical protein
MNKGLVEFYEQTSVDNFRHLFHMESGHFGAEMPIVGDVVIVPLSKKDMHDRRDPTKHEAYEVLRRHLVPDEVLGGSPRLKLLVKRRTLTKSEASMWST